MRRGGDVKHMDTDALTSPSWSRFSLMVTRHQKLSANRSRWLNLDVRAMDTDTARKKKNRRTFVVTSDGEAESVGNATPSLWLRRRKTAHIQGVGMTRHLIYGTFSAPSDVALDIRAGGKSRRGGSAVLKQPS